ncbi:MAG: ShlB/FhaC/HecB family hemolysin secretion/activation protein [Solidesulfovibrio sp.]
MKSCSRSRTTRRSGTLAVLLALSLCPIGFRTADAAVLDVRVPNSGAAMQESQSARPTAQPQKEEPDIVKENGQATPGDQNGPTIFVREFKLENVEFIPEAEIQKELEPFRNRNLTMAQLEEAARAVTALYQKKGYTVAKAYLPKQSVTDGVIVIRVLVGSYAPPTSENDSLVRDWFINKSLKSNLPEGQPVRRSDLERAVLVISDMPGAAMPTINIGPGQTPGTTEVFTQVPKGKRIGGYVLSDDMGSRYTGRLRVGAGVDINSPFGLADKLSVYALRTTTAGLLNYGVDYGFPLTPNGLRLTLGYSHVYYELGDDFKDLEASGTADIIQGTFSYPLIRSSTQNLFLSLNVAHKAMENNYAAFDERKDAESTLSKLGLVHEAWTTLWGRPLYTRVGGYVTGGALYVTHGDDSRYTDGWFSYGSLEFLSSLSLTEHWSLSVSGSGQKSFGKNLDSSEQFITTGARGVKAYRETVSGDNGFLLNSELKYKLPTMFGVEHALGGFVDYGGWSYEKSPYPDPYNGDMTDIGLGYYMKYGLFSGKVQLVQGLGDYPTGLTKESQTVVCASLMLSF